MLELYKNIKRIREEKGMSQEELARLVGFKSRSSINKIEMGVNDITQSKLVAIANALGVSPGELMGSDDPASAPASSAPQKSDGLPELNARDEREIERDLADMMHSVAMANYTAPGEKEDAEALEAALRFAMVQAKRMAKKKYTPRKYRKDER